MQNSSKANLW